ncbi:MAG: hypothetical protein HOJ19_09220, partial [Candidatus Marinimicrobia bacterium]|nr:hypothetical protein [Candidatus Neomarinimicrobiota bacterium]MBT5785745.1 hypothetical protein [Candidatus Neomarinimicrobiota bacterium]MBT6303493.1 hypothetical protein [Candidatus Neomarinimicrobiota bacterium]
MDVSELTCKPGQLTVLILVAILFLVAPCILQAGVTGKISGKINSAETGDPVIGASIQVVGSN